MPDDSQASGAIPEKLPNFEESLDSNTAQTPSELENSIEKTERQDITSKMVVTEELLKETPTARAVQKNIRKKKTGDVVQKNLKELKTEVTLEDVKHTLGFIEEVPLKVQVEVARKRIKLGEVLAWHKEKLIQFEKVIGELVDIFLEDNLIARGEIVIINDHYGVRITEITRPGEKL